MAPFTKINTILNSLAFCFEKENLRSPSDKILAWGSKVPNREPEPRNPSFLHVELKLKA